MKRRTIISLLLVLAMLMGLFPTAALAAGSGTTYECESLTVTPQGNWGIAESRTTNDKDCSGGKFYFLQVPGTNGASWEEVKALLADKMGFWEELPLTWEQEKMLRDEYETSFVKNKVVFEESLYAKTEPLAAAARKVMSQIAMVGWTGSGHTAGYVPVFAIGAGSDLFVGKMDNTEIPKRIAKAAGYK